MLNRKKLNVRIAPDLYRHLKENASTTMTDYVETLLMKGLMSDISDIYKDAQDLDEENGLTTKLKFINRLTVELA